MWAFPAGVAHLHKRAIQYWITLAVVATWQRPSGYRHIEAVTFVIN